MTLKIVKGYLTIWGCLRIHFKNIPMMLFKCFLIIIYAEQKL